MVIEFADEPKKPASDLVNEARELLSKATKRPWQCGGDYWTNKAVVALYGTSFVAQCSASDQGEDDAKFIARAPDLTSQLCDELDQQTSRVATQAESLSTCHDRMKLQKEAIDEATEALLAMAEQLDEWATQSREGGWSTHQVDPMKKTADALRRKVSGLIRKGGQSS